MQEKDPERYKEVKAEYEEEKRKNKKFISKYYEKTLKSSAYARVVKTLGGG